MKRQRPYLREMRAFHSWVGLFLGWVLFGILVTGSLAVFHTELDRWGLAELPPPIPVTPEQAVARSALYLRQNAPYSRLWRISLPDERDPYVRAAYKEASGEMQEAVLNAGLQPVKVRQEQLGAFFLLYHSHLLMKRSLTKIGLFVVGASGIAMLVVCISGIWSHIKIVAEFFTFRVGRNRHKTLLDLHTVLGVIPLPFHLMISYTGLVMLYWLYVPSAAFVVYGPETAAFRQEALGTYTMAFPPQDKQAAPLFSLEVLLQDAQHVWGQESVAKIYVRDPLHAAAITEIWHERAHQVGQQYARRVYDGASGSLIAHNMPLSAAAQVQSVLAGLHWVEWGGAAIRWCYALTGLLGAGLTASGLILYCQKRLQAGRPGTFLARLAQRLNVVALISFSCACVCVFWAERMLPYTWLQRNALLPVIFLLCWFLLACHAFCVTPRAAWWQQGAFLSVLCLLLPLAGVYRRVWLIKLLAAGGWAQATPDLLMFGGGCVGGFLLLFLHSKQRG